MRLKNNVINLYYYSLNAVHLAANHDMSSKSKHINITLFRHAIFDKNIELVKIDG